MYEIYLITCVVNNRKYVGITRRGWKTRVSEHLKGNGGSKLLTKDVKRFGSSKFKAKLLIKNISSKQLGANSEQMCIRLFKSHKYLGGYNTTLGGEFIPGYKHLPEHGKLISSKLINVKKSDIHRKHLSEARRGKYTKYRNGFYKKHHTPETKKYLSDIRSKKIAMIDKESDCTIKVFDSLLKASEYLVSNGITSNTSCNSRISKCCLNKPESKSAYGYKWKYIE